MKIGLGTVQFGIDYGVSNALGKTGQDEVRRILLRSAEAGINVLDTASLYGAAEQVLGDVLSADHHFKIITKTPVFHGELITAKDADSIRTAVYRSLELLQVTSIYGLLLHHGRDLLSVGGDFLIRVFNDLKKEGVVNKVGVSLYDANTIDRTLEIFVPDLVQVPVSVADQRLLISGHLSRLKQLGVEIHARSLFLQGLLLMSPSSVPAFFDPIKPYLKMLRQKATDAGVSMVQLCVSFGLQCELIDQIILGVTCVGELEELLSVSGGLASDQFDFGGLALDNMHFLDASSWKLGT